MGDWRPTLQKENHNSSNIFPKKKKNQLLIDPSDYTEDIIFTSATVSSLAEAANFIFLL